MEITLNIILIIIAFGFLAAFIDAVVGGGGLISTPALLAIGMPPLALGTNKLASSFGSLTSAIKFIRSGKVDLNIVLKLFPFVFIFAAGGASLATMLPAQILSL